MEHTHIENLIAIVQSATGTHKEQDHLIELAQYFGEITQEHEDFAKINHTLFEVLGSTSDPMRAIAYKHLLKKYGAKKPLELISFENDVANKEVVALGQQLLHFSKTDF